MLYIPGHYFRKFYYSGRFTKQLGFGVFAERFLQNLFWGFVVQSITLFLFVKLGICNIDSVILKFQKFYNGVVTSGAINFLEISLPFIALYSVASLIISVCLGSISYIIVRTFRLDLKIKALRFSNKWNYVFKGEREVEIKKHLGRKKVIFTEVDILFDTNNGNTKLYSGMLIDYELSRLTLELESITITNAKRYSASKGEFVSVPGHMMVFKNNNILNLNFRYRYQEKKANIIKVKSKIIQTTKSILSVSLFALLFYIPIKFAGELNVWRIIVSEFITLVLWPLLMTVYSLLIAGESLPNDNNNKRAIVVTSSIFAIIMVFLLLITLGFL